MKNNNSIDKPTIYFDLFDTLVTVDRGYLEPYFDRETDRLGDMGMLPDAKTTIERLVSMHPQLLNEHTVEEMAEYYEGRMSYSLTHVSDKVLNMLKDLKESGHQVCVISDAAFVDIMAWDKSPLSQYFDNTVFSCEVGYVKPDQKLFAIAKNEMGDPTVAMFIGDGGHEELQGAQLAGMLTGKAEWIKNRRDEVLYEHSNFRFQENSQVMETVREVERAMNALVQQNEIEKAIDIEQDSQTNDDLVLGG